MRQVPDAFLLLIAEASSGLTGLFLVGVFFYVDTGFRRPRRASESFEAYIRASTRIVLVLFGIAIALSLALVALDLLWPRLLLALLGAALIAANVNTVANIAGAAKVTGSHVLLITEVLGTIAVVGIVALPWILGGLHPSREDLTWSILLAFGTGLVSIFAIVMSIFDITRLDSGDDARERGNT
jgi:hypothetical protein